MILYTAHERIRRMNRAVSPDHADDGHDGGDDGDHDDDEAGDHNDRDE